MRIDDDLLKGIVYLGHAEPDNVDAFTFNGTGFLVSHGNPPINFLVTAAHVVRELGDDSPFSIRLNDKNGRACVDHIEYPTWVKHPHDGNVDVAVMRYSPPEWADTEPWNTKWSVTEFKRSSKNIGAGDLAYIVGMYRHLPGERRNMPIVHTGHIAMMADDERIPMRNLMAVNPDAVPPVGIEGYLVEAQTLDGLSGSPVFARRTLATKQLIEDLDANRLKVWWHGSMWLLGLWRGAWYGEPENRERIPRNGSIKVPVGMGIVIPVTKILEVIEAA